MKWLRWFFPAQYIAARLIEDTIAAAIPDPLHADGKPIDIHEGDDDVEGMGIEEIVAVFTMENARSLLLGMGGGFQRGLSESQIEILLHRLTGIKKKNVSQCSYQILHLGKPCPLTIDFTYLPPSRAIITFTGRGPAMEVVGKKVAEWRCEEAY